MHDILLIHDGLPPYFSVIRHMETLKSNSLTIRMTSCCSANSFAPVALIQSFLFNLRSLVGSTVSSLEIPSSSPLLLFCLFISPFYLLCLSLFCISLLLCLISFYHDLEVVWGSHHSLTLCLPTNLSICSSSSPHCFAPQELIQQ